MKKLFNHTKRPDRNWEEDVQDGYDWDEEQDGEEYYADDEEYTGDEDGEEFNSEDMVEMYDGIYVKTFVIFFGELIRYYITEEHDNSIEVKESNRLTCNNIPGDNDHSRYNLINEMIISDTLSDETTLKSNIDEYKRLDAATKQLFKLI